MGSLLVPTAAQMASINAASAADNGVFHKVDLSTKRTRFDAGVNYSVSPTLDFTVDFFPEHKAGLKPMGTVSRNTGADISTIIPDVIDTDTNQLNLSVNYKGAKSYVQAGYYGSFFRNRVPFMSGRTGRPNGDRQHHQQHARQRLQPGGGDGWLFVHANDEARGLRIVWAEHAELNVPDEPHNTRRACLLVEWTGRDDGV
jgi:hypothetical protein